MPTYQYECDACQHTFEILQTMLDAKLKKCPQCGKNKLHRLIGAGSGIIFKGSGFYETDYKKKVDPQATPKGDPKENTDKTTEVKTDSKSSSTGDKAKQSTNQQSQGSEGSK